MIGKILMGRTADEMRAVAVRYGITADGRIDLREGRCRFNHSDLDLRAFLLEGSDLSGSVLTNCTGEDVSFARCKLKHVRISADKGKKVSFRGASFDGALFDDVTLGPRTLDLSATAYRKAKLRNATFMMGKLDDADFSGAQLEDVFFRSAELKNASFRGASLARVSFEKATLEGADFTEAEFHQMEQWGEPNFAGAEISDDLRYRYGIIRDPFQKIVELTGSSAFHPEEVDVLRSFLERHRDFLSNPEVMLIGSEYEDDIDPRLFVKMMKALKEEVVH